MAPNKLLFNVTMQKYINLVVCLNFSRLLSKRESLIQNNETSSAKMYKHQFNVNVVCLAKRTIRFCQEILISHLLECKPPIDKANYWQPWIWTYLGYVIYQNLYSMISSTGFSQVKCKTHPYRQRFCVYKAHQNAGDPEMWLKLWWEWMRVFQLRWNITLFLP